jgi:hypothetical protein
MSAGQGPITDDDRNLLVSAILRAGAAILGVVGIDQTTPGTTNGVVQNVSAITLAHTAVTVGNVTPVVALAYTANHNYCLFANKSAQDMWLFFVPTVSYAITASSLANPTHLTCGQNIPSGSIVVITGDTTATPAINGTYVATHVDATHISIPVNVATAGTNGTIIACGLPVAGTGIPLNAGGGSYALPDDAGHISTQAVGVISAAGTGLSLAVTAG